MKRVLFVCVHNAGRSVMAEAMFNGVADGRAEAVSAGTEPQDAPHPEVVEAMREIGFDVSSHRGLMLTDDMVASADRVITMGCAVDEAACPAMLYADVEDWGLPDPKGQPPERVREIADQIGRRVAALVQALGEGTVPRDGSRGPRSLAEPNVHLPFTLNPSSVHTASLASASWIVRDQARAISRDIRRMKEEG